MFSLCGVNVHVLPGGPIETNAYLLTEASIGQAVLIDAPEGTWEKIEPLLKRDGCRLAELWLTHGHWDHTQGAAEVVKKGRVPVVAHWGDKELIETPEVMRSLMMPGIKVPPVKVDRWLEDGAVIEALGRQVTVSHVPGHSEGSLMFYFPAAHAAFSGDALFRANVGRTDLPGGDSEVLAASIRTKIYTLPEKTKVFPGHGGPTTVGDERTGNPYVRA
jgi:hydroxyacylglutathione hydrolase